jgi:hypothetical protein
MNFSFSVLSSLLAPLSVSFSFTRSEQDCLALMFEGERQKEKTESFIYLPSEQFQGACNGEECENYCPCKIQVPEL